jgi:predicted nucleic acid-binding protein
VTFIVDASVSLAWCFDDEWTAGAQALLDRAAEEGVIVPTIWPLEMANMLVMALRRKRIDASELETAVVLLSRLEIEVEPSAPERVFSEILDLACRAGLTSYDASYLDLALREALPLATRDAILAAAAKRAGVEVIGE